VPSSNTDAHNKKRRIRKRKVPLQRRKLLLHSASINLLILISCLDLCPLKISFIAVVRGCWVTVEKGDFGRIAG
jgi:hypothetical protein